MPKGALAVNPDGRSATLEMNSLQVTDQPAWPAHNVPATPATMSFRVAWRATDEKVVYEDKLKHFRVAGYTAIAQVEAKVEVPSLGFSWKSDPIETSSAAFALIGTEQNGKYYDI